MFLYCACSIILLVVRVISTSIPGVWYLSSEMCQKEHRYNRRVKKKRTTMTCQKMLQTGTYALDSTEVYIKGGSLNELVVPKYVEPVQVTLLAEESNLSHIS